jgi:hypothetical protein
VNASDPPDGPAFTIAQLAAAIAQGELEAVGRMPRASNATLFSLVRTEVAGDTREVPVVYKPRRGERPLWDFPQGTLCNREVASFVVAEALGWNCVPPTVLRDGPYGVGSVQLFIDEDPAVDVISWVEDGDDRLQHIAAFDVIANNADRKIGHCLVDAQRRVWGIDNGLTFNVEDKLRTVLWAWAGEPVPPPLLADVTDLAHRLDDPDDVATATLARLLGGDEMTALAERTQLLAESGTFPEPDPYGPSVPWPPY